jgi:hypothetical protein
MLVRPQRFKPINTIQAMIHHIQRHKHLQQCAPREVAWAVNACRCLGETPRAKRRSAGWSLHALHTAEG